MAFPGSQSASDSQLTSWLRPCFIPRQLHCCPAGTMPTWGRPLLAPPPLSHLDFAVCGVFVCIYSCMFTHVCTGTWKLGTGVKYLLQSLSYFMSQQNLERPDTARLTSERQESASPPHLAVCLCAGDLSAFPTEPPLPPLNPSHTHPSLLTMNPSTLHVSPFPSVHAVPLL